MKRSFLDLAGETRNQIYTYTVRNEIDAANFTTWTRMPGTVQCPSTTSCRGLTQICRQVRQEFLPLFQKCPVYPTINIQDIEHYIKTFLTFSNPEVYEGRFGRIRVDLQCSDNDKLTEVDIQPLFQILLRAPNLEASFGAIHLITPQGVPDYVTDLARVLRLLKTRRKLMREHIMGGSFRSIMLSLPALKTQVAGLRLCLEPGIQTGYKRDQDFIDAIMLGHMQQMKVVLCREE